jgi:hypothetical protein
MNYINYSYYYHYSFLQCTIYQELIQWEGSRWLAR